MAGRIAAVLIGLLLTALSASADDAIPVDPSFGYAARFMCGAADESLQEGVVTGVYNTHVIVSNPGSDPVRFEKSVVRALPFQRAAPVSPVRRDEIPGLSSLAIECTEIRTMLPHSMTAEFRSGILDIRAEARLEIDVELSARGQGGDVTSIDREAVVARERVCPAGSGGPDCSIDCRGAPLCDVDLFYNPDGTVNGVIARGTLLTGTANAFDADAILADLRDWMREHGPLLGQEPLDDVTLDHIQPSGRPVVSDGALVTHLFAQTYRGEEVAGPEATIAVTAGDFRGILSIMGTVIDPRPDYAGLDAPLPEAAARASMRDWFRELTGRTEDDALLTLDRFRFVAVPQHRTMGYIADIGVGGFGLGTILVSAAVNDGERAPLLSFVGLKEHPEDTQQVTIRAEDMATAETYARFGEQVEEIVTNTLNGTAPLAGQPLMGSLFTPDACTVDPTTPGCGEPRLANPSVVLVDAQGLPLSGEDADPLPVLDAGGQFTAAQGTNQFGLQDQFYKLLNALRLMDSQNLNRGRWETESPATSFPPGTYTPRLLMIGNAATESCPDQAACAGSFSQVPGATAIDIPPHEPPGGGTPEPHGLVYVETDVRTVMFHEFGHTLDSFTARGILGRGFSGSGCQSDGPCIASCMLDTPDEAQALAETVADMTQIFMIDRLYAAIPYDQCDVLNGVSNSGSIVVHHPDCIEDASEVESFANTRPTEPGFEEVEPGVFEPTGVCSYSPGYRQDPVYQAWWKILNNRDCAATAPFDCTFGVPGVGPAEMSDIGMQAALYALRQTNAASYKMFFANMALYSQCVYGEEIGDFVRGTLELHGLVDAGGPPLICPAICGDGVAEDAEQCDAPDLTGNMCTTVPGGFSGGTLGCTAQCTFDTSLCTACGNGIVEPGEQCDGADLDGATCISEGFDGGDLACNPASCTFETDACTEVVTPASCPDDGEPGDVGCACEPATLFEPPDGPGSFLTTVSDPISIAAGSSCPGSLICGLTMEGEVPENTAVPVCLECPPGGNGDGTVPYGCPCTQNSDCMSTGTSGPVSGDFGGTTVALTCWGDADGGWSGSGGTCLPQVNETNPNSEPHPDAGAILTDEREEFARTKWLCKVPCGDLDVTGSSQHECAFESGPISFDYATCLEDSCEGSPGAICADDVGGHCGPNDSCVAECSPVNNGLNAAGGNPDCQAYGYPDVWQCTTWLATARCGPPECVEDPLTGGPGDLVICDALTYGNLTPQ